MKRIAIAILLFVMAVASCRRAEDNNSVESAASEARSTNRVERMTVWSCTTHEDIQMTQDGQCPICLKDTVQVELVLTYGMTTRYYCPDHGGGAELPTACPTCGKKMQPFHTEALINEERRIAEP
jgi:rubrerythrin